MKSEDGPRSRGLTIRKLVEIVFPEGTFFLEDLIKDKQMGTRPDLVRYGAPVIPYDLFAFCGHLIQASGLLGFFEPDPDATPEIGPDQTPKIILSREERDACARAGKEWLDGTSADGSDRLPRLVVELWDILIENFDSPIRAAFYEPLRPHHDATKSCPEWWRAAIKLLIIADEASEQIGHVQPVGEESLSTHHDLIRQRWAEVRQEAEQVGDTDILLHRKKYMATYAAAADPGIVCVQPKGRVSQVGCTLRNLSKNLAITGPIGGARCSWNQLSGQPKAENDEGLDILLVPIPYELNAADFSERVNGTGHGQPPTTVRTSDANFELAQPWLEDDWDALQLNIKALIKQAQHDVRTINAVIFPELALSYTRFRQLCSAVKEAEENIEFVISGSSSNCEGESCNCVMTAIWEDNTQAVGAEASGEADQNEVSRITSQKKHHRWKLDERQIAEYALSATLNPARNWWESHQIGQRELNFFQFRKDSVFSTLVCEDLARSEPVHDVMRSVAPNLLFALLMDGAQLPTRWSSRYASTLADDPGTSVLTLTSLGLIKRVNDNARYEPSNSIGLWKDETGQSVEVRMPSDAKAVLVSLCAAQTIDSTLDGRQSENARSWRFQSQKPIYLPLKS